MTQPIQEIPLRRIDGAETSLGAFSGDVLLVVNVASKCGLTPQYTDLQALQETYRDRGFKVLGFPCNDFAGQEPGTPQEIQSFCSTKYQVDFPLFEKLTVKSDGRHPLYAALIEAQPRAQELPGSDFKAKLAGYGITPESEEGILWNFEKFLIARDGRVVARFAPDVPPKDALIVAAVEGELGAQPGT